MVFLSFFHYFFNITFNLTCCISFTDLCLNSNSIQADALITAASTLVLAVLNSLTLWFYFSE